MKILFTSTYSLLSRWLEFPRSCWVCILWVGYFKQLYQVDPPTASLEANGVVFLWLYPLISKESPTLNEVSIAWQYPSRWLVKQQVFVASLLN